MKLLPNNWTAIRSHYAWATPLILAQRRDEWAIDAYAWCEFDMIHMTPIEYWLWADIRECNAIFYPQYPVCGFFVDFANPAAKVVIECDGAAFHQDRNKDAARDRKLEELGWTVYRFPGYVCKTDSDPETGRLGQAGVWMRRIVLDHGLSRNGSLDETMYESLKRYERGEPA